MKHILLCCLMSTVLARSSETLDGLLRRRLDSTVPGTGNSTDRASRVDKIVGGREAIPGEIPWQASVKTLQLVDGVWQFKHFCGATIIGKYWLLSAAHCFDNLSKWKWQVTVGEFNVSQEDIGEEVFEVEAIYNHDLYDKETALDYDVALIKIKPSFDGRGIKFNDMVGAACIDIPRFKAPRVDDELLVSGWGDLSHGSGRMSDVLQKASVPLIDQSDCEDYYPYRITARMFCAGYREGQVDSCQGDSGGPIVYKLGDSAILYGIVSWGEGCAKPNNPGVYARVSKFVSWIEETIESNSDNVEQINIHCSGTLRYTRI